MDVKVFKTFLEVAKTRHFGRAAENLYITQAATSARIKQLESFFGTSLFIRDRNNIKLTSSGERLVAYADIMVNTLEQAKNELALSDTKSMQLILAGTPNIWDAYLQRSLSLITNAFSGCGFQAEALSREQLNRNLIERTLDIAFSFDPLKSDELQSKVVTEMSLLLVSTQDCDVMTALSDNYVYIDWGTRFASEHASRHNKAPAPFLRTSTGRIALDFILDNTGAAYLPSTLVSSQLATKQLFIVEGAELWQRPIYINYRKNAVSMEAIARVEALLQQVECD
ncbi:LysR family transcriptional regulator [Shewanella eurypsychrophilus]|uniref:LysR family transcriptional regulator n=1 Tax=Shewanella eurypsychrophilus TaxID=2593656 RepID=A0ABX6VBK9_9GAMM|nr:MULTISPECIES: LysR family transcriptional regulator [Shewanella]QFU23996.1 LysR family transcriptional regulator [Shewanella sp. YLB-09]QPG59209.1 LysR family transcriptional regulator [Shewanella eurypsychrophilus]